ncbi:hypothetical protein AHMF7605_03395 [Adhaeribacter arboris]|uniref:Uncharacterized protein n=1 Tax=Adhaeribacter arboris TaxID=2072846 RepID=A0A2T2YAX4_9BACT|nr:hypothetical protein [Adhaeribacter arboris]PSR52636.1 hypothetical protein AHMF7605_03395 [Adhaeribacter arboris]
MKKILFALTIASVFTACGKSSSNADSTTKVDSTTPPASSDSANPVGVMMSDTSTSVSDSLNHQK